MFLGVPGQGYQGNNSMYAGANPQPGGALKPYNPQQDKAGQPGAAGQVGATGKAGQAGTAGQPGAAGTETSARNAVSAQGQNKDAASGFQDAAPTLPGLKGQKAAAKSNSKAKLKSHPEMNELTKGEKRNVHLDPVHLTYNCK